MEIRKALLKHLANLGFWLGLSTLVLTTVDKTLSDKQKAALQASVGRFSLRLCDLTISTMYGFLVKRKTYSVLLAVWFAPSVVRLIRGLVSDDQARLNFFSGMLPDPGGSLVVVLLSYPIALLFARWVFAAKTIFKAGLRILLGLLTIQGATFVTRMGLFAFFIRYSHGGAPPMALLALYYLSFSELYIFSALAGCLTGGLAIFLFRLPIAWLAESLFWIATRNKGAWATLSLILTILLGLSKLFL